MVGGDNEKNGADRLVDGVQIQSKYCESGAKCIAECFEDGKFRYFNKADGSPMQIEVPSDMYEAAVKAMEQRISRGQVKGVQDRHQDRRDRLDRQHRGGATGSDRVRAGPKGFDGLASTGTLASFGNT